MHRKGKKDRVKSKLPVASALDDKEKGINTSGDPGQQDADLVDSSGIMEFAVEGRGIDAMHDWVRGDVEEVVGGLVHTLSYFLLSTMINVCVPRGNRQESAHCFFPGGKAGCGAGREGTQCVRDCA